jgi:hypothetical protein
MQVTVDQATSPINRLYSHCGSPSSVAKISPPHQDTNQNAPSTLCHVVATNIGLYILLFIIAPSPTEPAPAAQYRRLPSIALADPRAYTRTVKSFFTLRFDAIPY